MVNDVTEGLVYHSDIFDEEPLSPGLGFRGLGFIDEEPLSPDLGFRV
jgi:hypothetical protein